MPEAEQQESKPESFLAHALALGRAALRAPEKLSDDHWNRIVTRMVAALRAIPLTTVQTSREELRAVIDEGTKATQQDVSRSDEAWREVVRPLIERLGTVAFVLGMTTRQGWIAGLQPQDAVLLVYGDSPLEQTPRLNVNWGFFLHHRPDGRPVVYFAGGELVLNADGWAPKRVATEFPLRIEPAVGPALADARQRYLVRELEDALRREAVSLEKVPLPLLEQVCAALDLGGKDV